MKVYPFIGISYFNMNFISMSHCSDTNLEDIDQSLDEGIVFNVPSNKDFRLSDSPVHHDQRDHSRHSIGKTTNVTKHGTNGIIPTHEATNSSYNTCAKRKNKQEEGSIYLGHDLEHVRHMTYVKIRLRVQSLLQKKYSSYIHRLHFFSFTV